MKPVNSFLENGASIEIGEYTIREGRDGTFLIERESGETLETSQELLEEIIADFYKEHA